MKFVKKLCTAAIVTGACHISTGWGHDNHLADILLAAESNGQLLPVLSLDNQIADTSVAYGIQKDYVEKKLATEKLAGFKAGLTSKGGQEKFGVSEPVAGVLFASGKLSDGAVVDSKQFHLLMLETEIGFVVGSPISDPVPDVAALQQSISSVMPVIELPDLGFADMKSLTGVDIIAANVAAKQFIVGKPHKVTGTDLNAIDVSLKLQDNVINNGKGSDASGDQWQAALWLVNTMIEQGWTIEPGQILISGALGKMLPGKPGKYTADYGAFGKLVFEVK